VEEETVIYRENVWGKKGKVRNVKEKRYYLRNVILILVLI
jgi:hypothetical protein